MGNERKRILVVEDDPTTQAFIAGTLKLHYRITTADDGFEGLEKATGKPKPDLIITDVMMPKLDGLQMVGLLRKYKGLESIPVIFVTARANLKDILAGITVGADYYITKPFHIDELLAKVRRIFER